ncbi:GNAT family acetyltransferase [Halobacterium hubeiense]|jgi:GNAT superfamily N-acetyltransferase|uniref:GNAT family acetyltransferase n=2 Tax=Halobacterium TaxID=2239 RepID=A0A0U5GY92_9EURY|nr:GNAT family N-acetyltransferase [Halobacterium hubeiense]CQH49884.1 GNAT family acetyltransferase [Halobacterium hubeiense]
MRIREATADDAQTVKDELLVPGFRETAAVAPEYSELDEEGVADAGIDRWLGDDDRVLFVAEADDSLAGYVSGGRHDSPTIYARGPYANVDGLYVKPALRRDGLADRLLDRFEAWAAEWGCEHVGVSAHVENGAALALYDDRYERTYVSYRGRLGDE